MPNQFLSLSTDATLGGNSSSNYIAPSQKAIKDYVDSKELTAGKDLEIVFGILPTGYTQLEYIESDGSQWLSTDVTGLNTGEWVIYAKWMLTDTPTKNYAYVVGASNTEQQNAFRIITRLKETTTYLAYGNSSASSGGFTFTNVAANTIHEGFIRNGSVEIDGVSRETTVQGDPISAYAPIRLSYNGFVGRIYGSYATKNGVRICNLIPGRRISDGEIGMYDTVSNTFKTNAGTGDFVAGPETTNKVINFTNESGYAKSTDIPTVNNPTITITQGGVTKGSFTLNQASGDTIALDAGGGGGSADIDNLTITENANQKIQAVAVIDQNTGIIKSWSGTGEEYEDISEIDPDTLYITDDLGLPATEIGQITEALNDKVDKGHQVIEFQEPTSANGYIWYRKYADGWVEMGGQTNDSTDGAVTITLPVQLADANYVPLITGLYITNTGTASNNGASKAAGAFADRTTTSFKLWKQSAVPYGWEVKGMAA